MKMGNPKIFSGGHNSLASNKQSFYLSQDGLSIASVNDNGDLLGRIELNTLNRNPQIFSGNHSTLAATKQGFCLSQDGLSIGTNFVMKVYHLLSTKILLSQDGK